MLRIFHHNDADGLASAYLITKMYKMLPKIHINHKDTLEIKLYEMDYSKPFPIEDIEPNDTIFILDYSIEPEEMTDLISVTTSSRIIWIDHHKSAIDKYSKCKMDNIDGVRRTGISASALTYLYLFHDLEYIKSASLDELYHDFTLAPLYLQLINDWDVWNHNIPETKPFMIALNSILNMKVIEDLDNDAYESTPLGNCLIGDLDRTTLLKSLIDKGNNYIEYRDSWSSQLRDRYGFETEIYDYSRNKDIKAFVLNVGNANSEYFGDTIDKYDVIISVCFNGEFYRYSMYSNKPDIDCGKICAYYGVDNGGGHPGAGGFIHSKMLFRKA